MTSAFRSVASIATLTVALSTSAFQIGPGNTPAKVNPGHVTNLSARGNVSGIDVLATPGQPVRSLAFLRQSPALPDLQVETEDARLLAVLLSASERHVMVEATWVDAAGSKRLTRVRMLDR